jgi:putative membrane-bound dehydrogenase-like protein
MKIAIALPFVLAPFLALGAGKQLSGQFAPANSPALPPAEAQKKFVLPPGFEARLFAAEPDVVNPVAMTWDARGRLWILELYEYPLGAPPGTKPRDRIKILEDTDNDGRADKVTVFADGLNLATGLLLGNGGVYVGQAPAFLFLQDTNQDDVADTRTVLLDGFGLDDRHELLNGFTWGPDGWLYMTHGVFTHSRVKIPEASAPGVEVTAAVARYQPATKKFEVFADGTSNPWGVDFDARGNAFVSACVIDHLFHMAAGGIYARQGGVPGNPYSYELLPSIVNHKHHMAAYCGICIYQGDEFPQEYLGHVLMGNIHQCAINQDVLAPNGSSFKADATKDFLTTSDGWFRPVSTQVGPDGAVWIADWYDKYPCYQNAQADPEGVDRTRGRIWRIVYTGDHPGAKIPSRPDKAMDLEKLPVGQLVDLLANRNEWHRRMAQHLLGEKLTINKTTGTSTAISRLEKLAADGNTSELRLAAFWTLHNAGLLASTDVLDRALASSDPAVRAWAIRFAGEILQSDSSREQELVPKLVEAASDSDPTIRLAVATAARELVSTSLTVDTSPATRISPGPMLSALVNSSSDAKDPLLPFMIWMAAEPAFANNPGPGLDWLATHGSATLPLSGILAKKAMRRICDSPDAEQLEAAVNFLSIIATEDNGLVLAALEGLIEGQRAKPRVPNAVTKSLFAKLENSPNAAIKERSRELGTLWGDRTAVAATLAAINNPTLPVDERLRSVKAARELKNESARDALLRLVSDKSPETLRVEGIRGLGQIGGDDVADQLLKLWPNFSPAEKAAAADVLVSRRRWAISLLSALEAKTIASIELPMSAIRALAESRDEFLRTRAAQVIGRIRPANADKQKIIEEKKKMILAGGPPDVQAGHELVKKTCLVCHKLYGEGADVGPDLTGVGRSSLDALLANVIDPNQVVGKGYENVMIETKDGRSVSGRLVESTDARVKLLSSGPKEEVVARSDIESLRVSELSVMPEGLEQIPDKDFRNLILYVLHPPQERATK